MRKANVLLGLSLGTFLCTTGCDADQGVTTVDAAGGTVTSADGRLTLQIPAGAFEEPTAVEITQDGECMGDGGLACYALEPMGVRLNRPGRVTYRYAEEDMAVPGLASSAVWSSWGDDAWWRLADRSVDLEARTVTSTVIVLGDVTVVVPDEQD